MRTRPCHTRWLGDLEPDLRDLPGPFPADLMAIWPDEGVFAASSRPGRSPSELSGDRSASRLRRDKGKSEAMHGIIVEVRVDISREEEARKMLREMVVPRAKSHPGFAAGYWLRAVQGDVLRSLQVLNPRMPRNRLPVDTLRGSAAWGARDLGIR